MASGLYGLAGKLVGDLGSPLFQDYVGKPWAFGKKKEFEKLEKTLMAIQAVLVHAEERQKANDPQIQDWLMKIKLAFHDAEDFLQEVTTEALKRQVMTKSKCAKEVRIFSSSSNQLKYRLSMGRKLMSIRGRLDAIKSDRDSFNLIERGVVVAKGSEETHSFVHRVIGRVKDIEYITERLSESDDVPNVSVISIVGIGGMGKTDLAKAISKLEKERKHFELVMWVCVSNVFNVKLICASITESATNETCAGFKMDRVVGKLTKAINGKKYLLVLDDMWIESAAEWKKLEDILAGGAKGSKILVTTRAELVAGVVNSHATRVLEGLSDKESWELFTQVAFRNGVEPESSIIVGIGREVVSKFSGVPLYIKTIGSTLRDFKSETDWVNFRNNDLPRVTQNSEVEAVSILKLSYDYLSAPLKRCFAYCAIFPKSHQIERETLVRMWVAQGLVQSDGSPRSLEAVGEKHLEGLLCRSLFELHDKYNDGTTWCLKMHDLIHDVALSVGGDEYYNLGLGGGSIGISTRHAWVSRDTSKKLLHAAKLRTLVVADSSDVLDGKKIDEIMSVFKAMRLLDLGGLGIKSVPQFVGGLRHLHYLDLSGNTLDSLPECICSLYNLQTLILSGCENLRILPKETKNLVRLRHLHIDGCDKLSHMPRGLGSLTSLQTLTDFVMGPEAGGCCAEQGFMKTLSDFAMGRQVGENCAELSELESLVNLRGTLTIRNLRGSNTVKSMMGQSSYPTPLIQLMFVEHLELNWSFEDDVSKEEEAELSLWESLKPHSNLKKLSISCYGGKKFPSWMEKGNIAVSLPNVTNIEISSCTSWCHFTSFGFLPRLQELCLCDLDGIKYIYDEEEENRNNDGSSTSGDSGAAGASSSSTRTVTVQLFPSLKLLDLRFMPMLKRLVGPTATSRLNRHHNNGRDGRQFLTLKSLREVCFSYVQSPPKWLQYLPDLQTLQLSHCDNMVTLPKWMGNLTELREIRLQFCKSLASIPNCMKLLTSMRRLEVYGCPILLERCKKETGEDWHKISHIPKVSVTVYGSGVLSKIYYDTCLAPQASP